MPKPRMAIFISVVATVLITAPTVAFGAQEDQRRAPAEQTPDVSAERTQGLSLKDATAIVRQAYGGRVLSATRGQRRNERGVTERGYRLRVDIGGTVKSVFVDVRGRIHEG